MKWFENSKTGQLLPGFFIGFLVTVALFPAINYAAEDVVPIADAGSSRYAGQDPIVLDGTGSYDPDNSGPLIYAWQRISGPLVLISDAETATPTISGFVQTDEIQECEFELVVSDGELTSLPDTTKVIIVPDFDTTLFEQENPPFDSNKPTVIFFGGCWQGAAGGDWSDLRWRQKANIISFPRYPDPRDELGVGDRLGDMIIVYLSAFAPNYDQPIQTIGWSCGGRTAIHASIHLNLTYADRRYAVNRVTFLDVGGGYTAQDYTRLTEQFMDSSVDGEQAWVDNYEPEESVVEWFEIHSLSVAASHSHPGYIAWYKNSLTLDDMNQFNNGVIAGAYWSVLGPGKNLQLAPTPGATYTFQWHGPVYSGYMDFLDESSYPGRLPEPVTLAGPEYGAFVDANGALFSCEYSENAVGYQLLFGSDPHRVMDYYIISDTPDPPSEIITASPFEQTWWTVRVYDQYGSTIYADPVYVNFETLATRPMIENITTGQRYASIQRAIDDAQNGHEVVVSPGTHVGDINFKGKNLTLRSTEPNDSAIVASTIINGGHRGPVVTFSGGEDANCVLVGLTITGGKVGISCGDTSPTIRNCSIESTPVSIEFIHGYEPTIINCAILGSMIELYDPDPIHVALWKMDETVGNIIHDSFGVYDGICYGEPVWQPDSGVVGGALQFDGIDDYVSTDFVLNPSSGAFTVLVWVKGGAPGQVIISQLTGAGNIWLGLDASSGTLMTGLVPPPVGWIAKKKPLVSESIISDGQWHHIGFVWDGSYRILYVDGIEVAKDNTAQNPLKSANGGLHIGAGKALSAGTFFSGLIDDVRIYNIALSAEEIAALAQ